MTSIRSSGLASVAVPQAGVTPVGSVSLIPHGATAQQDSEIRIDSARNFFSDLSAAKLKHGSAPGIDLRVLKTDIKGGKAYLYFEAGEEISLESMVQKIMALGILKPNPQTNARPVIAVSLDGQAKNNAALQEDLRRINLQHSVDLRIDWNLEPESDQPNHFPQEPSWPVA